MRYSRHSRAPSTADRDVGRDRALNLVLGWGRKACRSCNRSWMRGEKERRLRQRTRNCLPSSCCNKAAHNGPSVCRRVRTPTCFASSALPRGPGATSAGAPALVCCALSPGAAAWGQDSSYCTLTLTLVLHFHCTLTLVLHFHRSYYTFTEREHAVLAHCTLDFDARTAL